MRRPRQANSDESLPEQSSQAGQAVNKSGKCPGSNSQDCLPFSAFLGPGLDYNIDHLSAENFFSDVVFSPHDTEYSHLDLAPAMVSLDQQQPLGLSHFTVVTTFQTSSDKCKSLYRNSAIQESSLMEPCSQHSFQRLWQLSCWCQTTISTP